MAELVDARDLKSLGRKAVPVRFRSRAPEKKVGSYESTFFIGFFPDYSGYRYFSLSVNQLGESTLLRRKLFFYLQAVYYIRRFHVMEVFLVA